MALWMPEFLQAKKYTAQRMRMLYGARPIQSGVVGRGFNTTSGQLYSTYMRGEAVSPAPSMNVVVKPGQAWIRGGYSTRQGMYHVVNETDTLVPIAPNITSVSRIDQVILRVYDEIDAPNDMTLARFEVLKGAPDAAADLSAGNRAGAVATLPPSSFRICDVQVDPAISAIENLPNHGQINDRRTWAFGSYWRGIQSSSSSFTGNVSSNLVSSGSFGDGVEIASGWARMRFIGTLTTATAVSAVSVKPQLNTGVYYNADERRVTISFADTGGAGMAMDLEWLFPVTPGHYAFGPWATVLSGVTPLCNSMVIDVREELRFPDLATVGNDQG